MFNQSKEATLRWPLVFVYGICDVTSKPGHLLINKQELLWQ